MVDRIMLREYRKLSKLRVGSNYKTSTSSKLHMRIHLSKYSESVPKTAEETSSKTVEEVSLPVPNASQVKASKQSSQQAVALTFYNLFSNSKYQVVQGGLVQAESTRITS